MLIKIKFHDSKPCSSWKLLTTMLCTYTRGLCSTACQNGCSLKKNFISSIQCKMFICISIIILQSCKPMGVKSWLAVSDAKNKKTIEKLSVHFLGFDYSAHIHLLRYCVPSRLQSIYFESISIIEVPCSFVILFLLEFEILVHL